MTKNEFKKRKRIKKREVRSVSYKKCVLPIKSVLLMKMLLVQESDWLKRNPHQQHHLMMERVDVPF